MLIRYKFSGAPRPKTTSIGDISFLCLNNPLNRMKKKVALITGGYSGDIISYKSAQSLKRISTGEKWDCYKIDINPQAGTTWRRMVKTYPVDKNDFSVTFSGTDPFRRGARWFAQRRWGWKTPGIF